MENFNPKIQIDSVEQDIEMKTLEHNKTLYKEDDDFIEIIGKYQEKYFELEERCEEIKKKIKQIQGNNEDLQNILLGQQNRKDILKDSSFTNEENIKNAIREYEDLILSLEEKISSGKEKIIDLLKDLGRIQEIQKEVGFLANPKSIEHFKNN